MSLSSAGASPSVGFDPESVRCVGVVAALHKRRIAAAVRSVAAWFQGRGVRVLLPTNHASRLSMSQLAADASEFAEAADFLLAIGGDGTFLAASRVGAPRGKPVLGVNLGGYGFLASIPESRMLEGLAGVMEGRLRVERRMMLAARVQGKGGPAGSFIALNDMVVGKGAFARLLRLETRISGELVSDFPVDGMIVATPTGSTGYAVAAGGPVVAPDLRALIVTPICSHALTARALIVSPEEVVELMVRDPQGEEVVLTADGQEGLCLGAGDRIEVREADFPALLIRPERACFYAQLRTKLGWVGRR
jgi:NAD+ kinase